MSNERDDLRNAAWVFGDQSHRYGVRGGLEVAAVAEYATMQRESGTFDTVADLCDECKREAAKWRAVARVARAEAKHAEEVAKAARRDLAAHKARVRAMRAASACPERKRLAALDNAK